MLSYATSGEAGATETRRNYSVVVFRCSLAVEFFGFHEKSDVSSSDDSEFYVSDRRVRVGKSVSGAHFIHAFPGVKIFDFRSGWREAFGASAVSDCYRIGVASHS